MPERYQFDWMDDVTEMFKGLPIVVDSPFVQQDKIEDIHVSNFTSDIDYMLLNPQSISPDGFCLLNAMPDQQGNIAVPVINIMKGSVRYRAQNGNLSFYMLQNPYWLYNMPAKRLIFNDTGIITQAVTVSRMKKQTVNIPLGLPDQNTGEDLDLQKLVTTGLGNGQIHSVSVRLTSRMAKIELRYDTEQ